MRHTLYLEELTHQLAVDWTAYRHQCWPASTNPHLLVSQVSAVDPDHPAVSMGLLSAALPRGLTLSGLRQDRILNEASESADPLRLMRLFGVTGQTAMRYVTVAHPRAHGQATSATVAASDRGCQNWGPEYGGSTLLEQRVHSSEPCNAVPTIAASRASAATAISAT
ncbi:hypothetical protein [Streptomyces sp. NPDC002564]|uniref:hypothetical protein n=1 Tax=Streptomyces sp. NPDC002564 TaxID=3364649 RepID=UPI0036923959